MTDLDLQWSHEQAIFLRFLASALQLRVRADSIRRGDGYDLACTSTAGEELSFDLTEITDPDWAAHISTLTTVPQLLNQSLREGQDNDSKTIRERYWDRDIAVTLTVGAGVRAMRRVLPRFFAWLAVADPDMVTVSGPPAELRQVIRRVEPRHFPGLNGLFFHVTGHAMWIGDDSVATIRAKFEKDYRRGIGLQLLAYFHRQPARPDVAASVRAYLDVVMPDESFTQVWLYDDQNRGLLLCYP